MIYTATETIPGRAIMDGSFKIMALAAAVKLGAR
jgi:hypothetical protein